MKDIIKGSVFLFGAIFVIYFIFSPDFTRMVNNWEHSLQKADDETNYDTLKKVEDTARAMISSYKSDIATYEAFKDSEDKDERSWANQAKIRANTTANTYNEYILKNSYVWKDAVPSDIYLNLEIIK